MTPNDIKQSDKLEHVLYDIRGPVLEEAKRLEEQGHRITKQRVLTSQTLMTFGWVMVSVS